MTAPIDRDHEASTWPARVGRTIRRQRNAQRLSQGEAALSAGLDPCHYGAVERGLHNLTLTTLVRIARGLNVAPAALLEED